MPSLSLMHWLLVGNIALLLLVGGLLWSLRRQQLREAQRLDHALAAMQQAQSGLSKSTVGMGATTEAAGRASAANGTPVGITGHG